MLERTTVNIRKRINGIPNQKGFTLIEVVLVLAIGGLIFLLAFLAFRQVSRNRRDTQRRSDLSAIVAQIETYKTNSRNGSALPPSTINDLSTPTTGHIAVFASVYINNLFDPLANNRYYNITSISGSYDAGTPTPGAYRYDFGTANGSVDCEGVALNSPAKYVIRMRLETGTVCRDNT